MATIFIGLGGSGVTTVLRIKEIYNKYDFTKTEIKNNKVIFAGIDIDNPSQEENQSIDFIPVDDYYPQNTASEFRKNSEDFKNFWPEDYLISTPLVNGMGAGKIRYNGRLVFWKNIGKIRTNIEALLSRALAIDPDRVGGEYHNIYLINSIGGGTGSGMFLDMGFLLRDILHDKPSFRLNSFIYHGRMWQTAGVDTRSYSISLGSLIQLEKWMAKPGEYKVKINNEKLPKYERSFERFFDCVYLIDEKTLDGKQFITKGSKPLFDYYIDLGSWILYTMSINKVNSSMQNAITALSNLRPVENRSRRYGSASVSVISIPYDEITDWLLGTYVKRISNEIVNIDLDPDQIFNLLNIYEKKSNSFSKSLLDTKMFKSLKNWINEVVGRLSDSEEKDIFLRNINLNKLIYMDGVTDRINEWLEKDINSKLMELEESFSSDLETYLMTKLKESFNFPPIEGYIESVITIIKEQIKKVSEDSNKERTVKIKDDLAKLVGEMNAIKGIFGKKKKFVEIRDNWIKLSGFKNNFPVNTYMDSLINESLAPKLIRFYENLLSIVNSKKVILDNMKLAYNSFSSDYSSMADSYSKNDENLLDLTKLQKNCFPLYINVPVDKDDLKSLLSKILEKEELRTAYKSALWDGVDDNKGLTSLLDSVKKALEDKRENTISNLAKEYSTSLKTIARLKLLEEFKKEIYNSLRIDIALKRHFEKKYQYYQGVKNYPDQKSEFERILEGQVGNECIGELKNPRTEQDEWIRIAIKGFLLQLSKQVKPFWSLSNPGELEALYTPGEKDSLSIPAIFNHHTLNDIFGEGEQNIHVSLDHDSFRIFILNISLGVPLYLLSSVQGIERLVYTGNEDVYIFNDKRFYKDWKDNIEYKTRFEFNDFLFILSLGFEFIKKDRTGYKYAQRNLGSITEAMKAVGSTIKGDILNEVRKQLLILAGKEDFVNQYNSALKTAENFLLRNKPVSARGNNEALEIWTHLYEKVDKSTDMTGEIKGTYYKTTPKEIHELIYGHTGLKLS